MIRDADAHDPEPLKTVTESGTPVDSRVTTPQAARQIFRRLTENDDEDARRRARLRGHVNGNPPYDARRLEELGLGYMSNTNFLEMRAILDAKAGMAYELFFEVPTIVDINLSSRLAGFGDGQQPSPDYGRIVAEEFSRMLLDWPGFLVNMDLTRRETDLVGIGPQLFRDEFDWRPKAFSAGSFKYPASAELEPDSWPLCAFKDKISAGDLYRKAVANPKVSKAAGWDPELAKAVLKRVYLMVQGAGQDWQEKYRTTPWEEIEQRIRNKDWVAELAALEDVQIVHMLVAEVDNGEVTHLIFADNGGQTVEPSPEEASGFLYRRDRKFKRMSNAVWVLPYNNAGGTLRSCRGLASLLEPHCDLSNRFLGRVFDAGFTTASLILQPATAMDMSKLQLVRNGVMTILPPGLNAIQTSFTPPISPLVQLRDLSSSIMRNNTGIYRQNAETFGENQVQKTARQVVEETAKEARAEKANTAFDYSYIERLYREMFNRATNPTYVNAETKLDGQAEARDFINRCVQRGVPPELLLTPGAFELRATRAIGMGSWGVKLDITNQLLNSRALMDEQGQRNAFREWLAVRVGYANVDRFASLANRDTIPSNEMSIATLENNSFANGQPVPVGSDQFHAIHLAVHASMVDGFANVMELASKGSANVDITKIGMALQQLLPHMQNHLKYLAQDPARADVVKSGVAKLQAGAQILKSVQAVAQKRSQQVEQARAEQIDGARQQGAQQMSEEMQLKLAEMEREYQLKAEKLKSLNDMRAQKTAENLQLQRERAASEIQLKAELQAAKIQIDQLKAQADIEAKASKTATPSRQA